MTSLVPPGKYVQHFFDCPERLLCWRQHLAEGGTPENFNWKSCGYPYGQLKYIAFSPELEREIDDGRPYPQFTIGYDDAGEPKIFVHRLTPDDVIETRTVTDGNGVKTKRKFVKHRKNNNPKVWSANEANDANNNNKNVFPVILGQRFKHAVEEAARTGTVLELVIDEFGELQLKDENDDAANNKDDDVDDAASASPAAAGSKTDPSFGQLSQENDRVVIFTDGSCFDNGKPNARAGIGVFFCDNFPLNVSACLLGKQSNGRAELQAAVKALMIVRDLNLGPVQIRTDSIYVKKGITTWIQTWKANGWRTAGGNRVKNVGDWKELDALHSSLDVEWKWVQAHNGCYGNEMADKLANEGANENQ